MTIRIEGSDEYLVDEDMSANIEGDPISLAGMFGASISCVYTGVPDGFLIVEGSTQMTQKSDQVTDWDELVRIQVVAPGRKVFDITVNNKWVRLRYEAVSGSGQLNARYNIKGDW